MNKDNLPDIQNSKDTRGKTIDRVGVKNIKIPLVISRKQNDNLPKQVYATIDMFANVSAEVRGANMSRFLEVLMEYSNHELTLDKLDEILTRMQEKIESDDVYIRMTFPYFIMKKAPESGKEAPQEVTVSFIGRYLKGVYEHAIQTEVYVTNCCPCSKEISFPNGAHNQRAKLTAKIVPNENLWWIEDIITLLENEGSCPIFPLLKRPDERWVTIKAYENPKFVEDLVRDVSIALENKGISKYSVKAEAEESIHIHNAYATISKDWNLG